MTASKVASNRDPSSGNLSNYMVYGVNEEWAYVVLMRTDCFEVLSHKFEVGIIACGVIIVLLTALDFSKSDLKKSDKFQAFVDREHVSKNNRKNIKLSFNSKLF